MNVREKASEALLMRDYLKLQCLKNRDLLIQNSVWKQISIAGAERIVDQLPRILSESEVILWTMDMCNAAIQGAVEAFHDNRIPESVMDLYGPQLWFVMDGALGSDGLDGYGLPEGADCDCLLLFPVEVVDAPSGSVIEGVYVFTGRDKEIYLRPTYPILRDAKAQPAQVTFIALSEFMRLTLVAQEKVHLPRADHRRRERESQYIPAINVIQLRRREASGAHNVSEREYQHQWIVKGHWRRLHAPRKKDGAEVTYVSPYVKGPDGAPLLPPRETVYAVTR